MNRSRLPEAAEPPVLARTLQLAPLLAKKSHFLFGPRQTGKSFLVAHSLNPARIYDLLDTATFLALAQQPARLEQELETGDRLVVIDEVQRLPELLNEVHRLIETRGVHFLLTGSSARKLRRGGANLLGGRARVKHLHPLTSHELGGHFNLARAASRGLLPAIYFSDDPWADLQAYAGSYLQQEIVAEAATRNVPAFSRFLKVAASCNGTIVNFTNLASDAQVPRTTVYEYFEILKDTLLIHEVAAWRKSSKRKPLASSKYYFFDVGVVGALQGRPFRPGTPEFGQAFETLVLHELLSYRDYVADEPIRYWRSTSGFEVDFIIGDHTAVELKGKPTVAPQDLRGLRALREEGKLKRLLCVSLEARVRHVDGLELLPVGEFLARLWDGQFRGG
jgi:predicted AAA+ superfamily ATPase